MEHVIKDQQHAHGQVHNNKIERKSSKWLDMWKERKASSASDATKKPLSNKWMQHKIETNNIRWKRRFLVGHDVHRKVGCDGRTMVWRRK